MRTRTIALAAALALGAGGLAACGGEDEAADTATQASAVATDTGSTEAAAPASGEPIRVGFLNQEKGAASFPDFGAGARAASAYLNEELGGVDGRPLELVECLTDGTPESSIDCANRFAEEEVAVVLQGIDFSSDAALPILEEAGIPLVGHTAFGTAQSVSEDAFFFGAALPAYGVAPLQVMRDQLDATSAVYVGADQKLIRAFVDGAIGPAAKELGIELTPIYYQTGSANFSSVITSAMAKKPDVIFTTAPDPDCIGMVKAASTLGYQGDLFAGSCSAFISADPSSADGVFTSSDLWEPEAAEQAPPGKREQIETYVAQMEQRAPDHVAGFAQDTFSSTMDLAAVLGSVEGEITPASVTEALRATAGLDSYMGQELTCDGEQWPGQPSACGAGILVYRVEGDARVPVTDGFVDAADLVG
ncbi:MAG TPA: ABC transporter substrate-binding protein [Capillimicrobium sp.]|nr:ABC transporter substrate-binding protein [Capillimicrobium sp.]